MNYRRNAPHDSPTSPAKWNPHTEHRMCLYLHFIPELIKKIEHNEIVQQRFAMAEAENEKKEKS